MSKEIRFKKRTQYLGRNGGGFSIGLDISNPLGDTIQIAPLNTKGNVAKCIIEVPYDNLRDVIKGLWEMFGSNSPAVPQKEIQYYVFGHQMSRTIDSEGFKAALKIARKSDFALVKHEPSKASGADLLAAYEGWDGYTELTEEQYNELSKYN